MDLPLSPCVAPVEPSFGSWSVTAEPLPGLDWISRLPPITEPRSRTDRRPPERPPPPARPNAPRRLPRVEADPVVGHVKAPVARRPLPHDPDRRSLRVLVHVLQGL